MLLKCVIPTKRKTGKTAAKPAGGGSRQLAVNQLVSALEERIYAGRLKSGGMLPAERELGEEFRVSRTVAREAVKILGGKGLVDMRPRHRPVVLQPGYDMAASVLGNVVRHLLDNPQGVEYLFNLRIFTETGLVRMAAEAARKEDIARLRAALEANRLCIGDSEKFYETDMAFHAAMYQVPRNPIYPALHRSFCDWLQEHWLQMPRLPKRNRRNYEAHAAIFGAILNRDADAAERALQHHLADAWQQVRRTFADLDAAK